MVVKHDLGFRLRVSLGVFRRRVRRLFWRAMGLLDPRCPRCHQRLTGALRMTPYGYCVECSERLWDYADRDRWGER